MPPTVIDLFSGCGGLSLGLSTSGFRHLFAVEAHQDAFESYRSNLIDRACSSHEWPDWLEVSSHDLMDLLSKRRTHLHGLRGTVDLISGGPPCQGFSTNGRRSPDDPRSRMVETYLESVEIIRPRLVLLENVRGFSTMLHRTGKTYADYTTDRLRALGYDCWSSILFAADWGVPQRRPRFILVAALAGSLPGIDPLQRLRVGRRSFLEKRGLWPSPTSAQDAIADLETLGRERVPDPEWGAQGFETIRYVAPATCNPYLTLLRRGYEGSPSDMRLARHRDHAVGRLEAILGTCRPGVALSPSERKVVGLKKRSTTALDRGAPSPTITTLPDDLVHYCEPRTMTVREHARLQSFPDWFSFKGPYTSGGPQRRRACPRYTQVANAVPPLFAEALGEMLLRLLASQKEADRLNVFEVEDEVMA